jgi:hypothetical protein
MVVRVQSTFPPTLMAIAARLLADTGFATSYNAIIRGLIAIGLHVVDSVPPDQPLAPLFAGCRIPRGRKPGTRRSSIVEPDLARDEKDVAKPDEPDLVLGITDIYHPAYDHRIVVPAWMQRTKPESDK